MPEEPFSTGADQSGTSGVGGYAAGAGPANSSVGGSNPAFGRSSRDLASDSGPAAAPEGLWSSTPVSRTPSDHTAVPDERRQRKTNPDVDPDTRLGLRPATARVVAPDLSTYPVSGTRTRVATDRKSVV